MNKKHVSILLCVVAVIVCWTIADYFVMKDPTPPMVIPSSSVASFYSDGYNCGWEDHKNQNAYDPPSAANKYYSTMGDSAYSKIDNDYAAFFSAGYGFGYYDYPSGEKTHRMEYTKWGEPRR